jgi:hypothetical protein
VWELSITISSSYYGLCRFKIKGIINIKQKGEI